MTAAAPANAPSQERQILVVDDDKSLREQMVAYLAEHGYQVRGAADAKEMASAIAAQAVDLVVLDIMMPGEDGLSICRRMAANPGPGVIMVSALGDEIDRVLGLELGADDYLSKPCSPRELLARVKAVLRRRDEGPVNPNPETARFLGFTLNLPRRQLRAPDGRAIMLTSGEFSLLSVFLENAGRILSREELLDLARGHDAENVFDRAIDVQISRLRRKLSGFGVDEIIRTYRRAGYMFDAKVTRA